jgi:SAM-dependent methyltransferase
MSPDEATRHLLGLVGERTGKDLASSKILDMGCGTRFAAGIFNLRLLVYKYVGIDIDKDLIDWLIKNIESPNMEFFHWPVRNPEYNPDGRPIQELSKIPVNEYFDIIIFFSVFTHLSPSDTRKMLELSKASLADRGRIFLTVFVHDDVDLYKEGNPDRPSLASRYNRAFFENIVSESGFEIERRYPKEQLMAPQYILRHKQ